MDSIFCWNVRGLNASNKQKEVILLCNKESTGLVRLLDTNEEIGGNPVNLAEVVDFQSVSIRMAGWNFLTKGEDTLGMTKGMNILTEADEDRDRLKQVQKTLQSSPTDLILQQQERELHNKFRRSSYLAEVFLQQRSKASWIKLGDDNTSYLYSIIKHKKLQDGVTQLKNSQDVLQTDYKMIAEFFVDYYQDMLGKERSCWTRAYPNVLRNGPKLSIDQ
ncbi:hypothetical protein RDI58_010444 [Solanum bulbocastanum]|uniref:Uncharacterized protein n=1 Tax=Solanum bulbocastanum TaxID=147425 RepID=A0AAN8TUX2_SOLBU